MNYRKISLTKPRTLNEELRSVSVVAATETPVRTYSWTHGEIDEILLMSGVVLPRSGQVPLLNNHSRRGLSDIIGSARSLAVSGGQLLSDVFYSELAETPWTLLKEGHLTDYSVGFSIEKSIFVPKDETARINDRDFTGPVSVVTAWTLKELSATPIGADPNAKSRNAENITHKNESANMPEETEDDKRKRDTPKIDVLEIQNTARDEERTRVREISAIETAWREKLPKAEEMANQAVREGWPIDKFRADIMEQLRTTGAVKKPDPEIGMSRNDLKQYSFIRAIRALAENKPELAGIEIEASRAAEKIMGRSPRGLFIPADVMFEQRAMSVSSELAAGMAVEQPIRWASFIDILRNKMAIDRLGATVLSGLVGDVSIPRQSASGSVFWVSEAGNVSEAAPALDQITMSPRTAGCYTDFTRKLLMQTSFDVENFARMDMAANLALAFDYQALHGDGLEDKPRGIEYTPGINTVVIGSTGGNPDWGNIVDFETQIAIDNADIGSMAYLTNAKVRGYLKTKDRGTDTGVYLWNSPGLGDGMLNGYRAVVSNQVRSDYTKTTEDLSAMFFGVWSQLIIGQWGALDISIDKAALALSGGVRVIAFNDVDFQVRQPLAFCFCKDIKTV